MSDTLSQLDQRILREIDSIRAVHHSCTLGQVSARLHMTKDVLRTHCLHLKRAGLIDWTKAHGSLHRVVDMSTVMFEKAVVLAVTLQALEQDVIGSWCARLLEDCREVGDAGEQRGEPTDVAPSPEPASQPAPGPDFRCAPCDRDFPHKGALAGHLTSKAHLAKVA